jgi:hypothetical protein
MKKIFLLLTVLALHASDYIPCFQEINKAAKVKTVLEFGVSDSTQYFLDTYKKVISVEVVTHGYGPETIKHYIQKYRDYSNWIPISYFSGYHGDMNWAPYKYLATDAVYKACSYQCVTRVPHYSTIDPFYIKEMNEFITNLVKFNKIDIAFINPALFLRGDIVELLFNKVSIIVAHETNARHNNITGYDDLWCYSRVVTPDNYEEIFIPTKEGTTIWISKKPEFEKLINALKQ